MITFVVSLTLLGAGDPGEQEGIDFPRNANVPLVTPGIPPTLSLQKRIDFFREKLLLQEFGINIVEYAELNDFVTAGLRAPKGLLVLPVSILIP